MAVKAFVLIQTEIEIARTNEVAAVLKKLGGEVKSVDCITGPYDIIVEIEGKTVDEISTLVDEKICSVAGVYRTVTCLTV